MKIEHDAGDQLDAEQLEGDAKRPSDENSEDPLDLDGLRVELEEIAATRERIAKKYNELPFAERLTVTTTAHFHLGELGVHQIADGRWQYEVIGPDGPRVEFRFKTRAQAFLQAEDDLLFFEDYYMRQQKGRTTPPPVEEVKAGE